MLAMWPKLLHLYHHGGGGKSIISGGLSFSHGQDVFLFQWNFCSLRQEDRISYYEQWSGFVFDMVSLHNTSLFRWHVGPMAPKVCSCLQTCYPASSRLSEIFLPCFPMKWYFFCCPVNIKHHACIIISHMPRFIVFFKDSLHWLPAMCLIPRH
jgi:hypothetical protein